MPKSKTTTESVRTRKTTPEARWQLQTAKARFSELFRRARSEGPQLITRRDKEGVVMISDEQYQRLVGKAHQPQNLLQFFRQIAAKRVPKGDEKGESGCHRSSQVADFPSLYARSGKF